MLERSRPRLIMAGLLAAVSGCAVGPDYHPPAIAAEGSFVAAGSGKLDASTPKGDLAIFWRGFNDPILSQLVDRAIAVNFDVRIAQERLQETRAQLAGTRAEELPELDLGASAARSLQPAYLFPSTTRGQRTGNALASHFIANWELDFFGRQRRASESAAAQLDASEAGVQAARTAVIAELARTYLELRGLQQRYRVAESSLANQAQTLKLTAQRLSAGRGTQLDVARASSLHDSTEAMLPALQAAIERSAFRLGTLAALSPRVALEKVRVPQDLPTLPATDLSELPIGTPEQMLRRRPDLRIAERQFASATANIGVATADLFPRISLTGLIGFGSNRVSQLGSRDSDSYSLGAGLVLPLLDFGRVRSRIDGSQAVARQALLQYEQTIAIALEETEGSLSQFSRAALQVERLASASRSANQASQLSRRRFDAGSVDLLIVLDAERQSLAVREALVQAQIGQAVALVNVYRALGGGWDATSLAAEQ